MAGRSRHGRQGPPGARHKRACNRHRSALATLVPHTTSVRGSRFEAAVSVPFLKAGAFDAQNLITIPHAKLLRVLGKLNSQQLAAVEAVVRLWLGFSASEV